MSGKKGGKKRFWSDEEKRSICEQARTPGISVAQVARRYAMNTNLIHKWLRDPRFVPDVVSAETEVTEFLPVEIEEAAPPSPLSQLPAPPSGSSVPISGAPLSAERVDITLSDGRRILVEGTTALSAVLSLVEGLMP
jgi:transposase